MSRWNRLSGLYSRDLSYTFSKEVVLSLHALHIHTIGDLLRTPLGVLVRDERLHTHFDEFVRGLLQIQQNFNAFYTKVDSD